MHLLIKNTRLLTLILMVLILSGCSMIPSISSNDVTTETASLIRTDSAGTVVAQITQDAINNPSSTPEPAEPTATESRPTAVEAAEAEAPTETSTVEPTATKYISGPVTKPAYACKIIKQDPRDGYPIEAAGFFDVTWTIQNTGTATWSEDFIYRYWKGDQIAKSAHFLLPRETLPDKTVELTADMIAPYELGKYTTWWELVDADGNRVCKFYASIVVDAPTEEPTLTPYY